jgi:hypothetical protein
MPQKLRFTKEEQEDIRQRAKTQFMTYIAGIYNVNVHMIHRVVHDKYQYGVKSQKREELSDTRSQSESSKEAPDRIHQEAEYQN